jgi:hypothetical protein
MSDFDTVLERLLTDPAFQAHLARDPGTALAGYALDASEVDLLHQQVASDVGATLATVEDRVSKSSTFGLFSSFGGGMGALTDGIGAQTGVPTGGVPADGAAGIGPGTAGRSGLGEWSEFGTSAGLAANAAVEHPAAQGFGDAPGAWGAGGGGVPGHSGLGSAPGLAEGPDLDGLPAVSGFGDAPRSGFGEAGEMHGGHGHAELPAPKGYHDRVDADGDGRLDASTYRGHHGGGAEILVDLNDDGKTDFIGVDKDLDNRVDFADYDKDHDGTFEKRMFDDDGDGFLDRSVWH